MNRKSLSATCWTLLLCLLLTACSGGDGAPGEPPHGSEPGAGGAPGDSTPPPEEPAPPPPNNPPTISGSPDTTLVAGAPWSFTPTASDADGDSLTFSISGQPGWLNFNSTTGQMSGTPSSADVGVHQGIAIKVSDGQSTANLAPFSLTVTEPQPGTGSVTLSWQAPTERVDGSPIGQLAGYRILFGQTSLAYDRDIRLDNPGLTRYVIEGLGSGTWYFAMTTITSDGLESAPSAEASKTFP